MLEDAMLQIACFTSMKLYTFNFIMYYLYIRQKQAEIPKTIIIPNGPT